MKKESKPREKIPFGEVILANLILFGGFALAASGFWAFPVESRHGPWLGAMCIWIAVVVIGAMEDQQALDSEPKPKTKRK